jgi:hypothetical protein
MRPLGRRLLVVALLGAIVTLGAPPVAHAHERTITATMSGDADRFAPGVAVPPASDSEIETPPPRSADAAVPFAGLLLGVAAALAVLIGRQCIPRAHRVVAFALVVILVDLTFESGIHSTHHLGDSQAASHCVVVASADHAVPAMGSVSCEVAPVRIDRPANLEHFASVLTDGDYRLDLGRAPPASAS